MADSHDGDEMSVDVIITTKDRPNFLDEAVSQARRHVPCHKIIIVESSLNPDKKLLAELDVEAVFTPLANLGYARQEGLLAASTRIVMLIDDDLTLEKNWFHYMIDALESASDVLAVSSKVVFGWKTNKVLEKLHRKGRRRLGASGGATLLKREEILKLGGFNRAIHRCEDEELELRVMHHGFKWKRVNEAIAYHPCNLQHYLKRAVQNGWGWIMIWFHTDLRFQFIMRRTGSLFIMPIYYMFLTCDPRVFAHYFTYKLRSLLTFLKEVKKGCIRYDF